MTILFLDDPEKKRNTKKKQKNRNTKKRIKQEIPKKFLVTLHLTETVSLPSDKMHCTFSYFL